MKRLLLFLLAAIITITTTILFLFFRGSQKEANQGPQIQKVIIERNIKLKNNQ